MSLKDSDSWPFEAIKYFSGVAVTLSLFDHVLTFRKELDLVWLQRGPWSIMQLVVVMNRYGGEASMLYLAYMFSGLMPLSTSSCHGLVIVLSVYCILGSALSQFVLLLRVYALWDNRRSVKYALYIGFMVCLGISLGFAITIGHNLLHSIVYFKIQHFEACVINSTSRQVNFALYAIGLWGGMLLYDVFVFVTLVANALSRPRRNNSEIVTNLSRDRIFTFLAFFVLRLCQLSPSISADVNYTFLTIGVCWTLDYILCFRLFLKMKDAEIRSGWEAMGTPGTVHIRETIEMMSI